jgi:lipopolysaccharide transport system permease protein
MKPNNNESSLIIIKPSKGWIPINFKEIWNYREILYFLTKRDIKVRYSQTILGGLWAIIQPLFFMLIFSLFFGKLAKMPSDGIAYPVFVYAGLVPWTYFANAVSASSNSLVGNVNLITKIYFPRIIIPASAALSGILDFFIAILLLGIMMIFFNVFPNINILLFPLLIFLTFLCAIGVGLWLSALNVKYRDIRYTVPFLIQIWLFLSPVIYPSSMIGNKNRWIMAFNPMAGVLEAYKACLLGHMPVDWKMLLISTIIIFVILIGGLFYFRKMEKYFADII